MKVIVAFLFITAGAAFAQTANDIQTDFTQTFNYYFGKAEEFVNNVALLLEQRVNQYIGTHQKLIDNFKSVQSIVTLDANNQGILDKIISRIDNLIISYKSVLSKDILRQELNKYTTLLQTQYLPKAQNLIDELKEYVIRFPTVGECWSNNKNELGRIIEEGFVKAKNAAVVAIEGANITLNINERLVNGMITGNEIFLGICKNNQQTINSCISTFLTVSRITIPIGSGLWGSTTNMTVSANLGISESQIVAATSSAVFDIAQIVRDIETCIINVIAQA